MRIFRPIVLSGLLLLIPAAVEAQRVVVRSSHAQRAQREIVPRREMLLSVGVMRYGVTGDNAPMAALRGDWRLARWVRSELGVAYALADVPTLAGDEANSHLVAATVGVRAELPWAVFRPYAGIAAGLFARFDEEGDEFVRPTIAVPVGVRIPLSLRVGLRGEVRWRFDEHLTGESVVSREHTAGVSFAY